MKSLWPNLKQWSRWSLPSRLTAIGVLIGVVALLLFLLEFGLQLVNSKAPQELPGDVEAIVERLWQEQAGEYRAREEAYRDQIEALTEAVASLAAQRGTPDAPAGLEEALNELAAGRTEAAQILLQRVAAEKEALGTTSLREAAEALRHLGALAFLDDTGKALAAYKKATKLDPENPEGWDRLGYLQYRIGDLDSAEYAYGMVLRLGRSGGTPRLQALAYGDLGIVYQVRGDLDRAAEMYEKALAIAQGLGLKEEMANQYGNLGKLYEILGNLNRAEEAHLKALALDQRLGRRGGMAVDYGNLGIIYAIRGELDRAVEMYEKAIALDQELGRKRGMGTSYGNLGNVLQIRGDLDRAQDAYLKALTLNEELGHKEGMANQYSNLGIVYRIRGDLDRAEEAYLKALELDQQLGRKEEMATDYFNLGIVHRIRGDLEQAREAGFKALGLYAQAGIPHRMQQMQVWLAKLRELEESL